MTFVTGAQRSKPQSIYATEFRCLTLLLIPGAMVCGCAGVTSGNSAQASAGSQTYSIPARSARLLVELSGGNFGRSSECHSHDRQLR